MNQYSVIPTHIGLILDGNRRWAAEHGLSSIEGHQEGVEVLKRVVKSAFDSGVSYVSAFVFSTENWDRARSEVAYITRLLSSALKQYTKDNAHAIRIIWQGSEEGVPSSLVKSLHAIQRKTRDNTHGTLILCFNHGGRQEITNAVKAIVKNHINSEHITEETVRKYLQHADIPDIDLLIRTSGEQRISNFMLWRIAYSELYFCTKKWPDFTTQDLDIAIQDYQKRQRRYGH